MQRFEGITGRILELGSFDAAHAFFVSILLTGVARGAFRWGKPASGHCDRASTPLLVFYLKKSNVFEESRKHAF